MTPLSQHRGCIVFWVTFPDGWHMLICFPAAISLFFTVRWSALAIPAVSLQQIPGYQQSNTQRLSCKTQLYPIWKTLPHPAHTGEYSRVGQTDVNVEKQTKMRQILLILAIVSLNRGFFRVLPLLCVEGALSRSVHLRRGNLKSLCHFR